MIHISYAFLSSIVISLTFTPLHLSVRFQTRFSFHIAEMTPGSAGVMFNALSGSLESALRYAFTLTETYSKITRTTIEILCIYS